MKKIGFLLFFAVFSIPSASFAQNLSTVQSATGDCSTKLKVGIKAQEIGFGQPTLPLEVIRKELSTTGCFEVSPGGKYQLKLTATQNVSPVTTTLPETPDAYSVSSAAKYATIGLASGIPFVGIFLAPFLHPDISHIQKASELIWSVTVSVQLIDFENNMHAEGQGKVSKNDGGDYKKTISQEALTTEALRLAVQKLAASPEIVDLAQKSR